MKARSPILQHHPMKWPPDRPVDWPDASERRAWVSELRDHIFDLFVVGLNETQPPPQRHWTRPKARRSLHANKQVIDALLYLAGAPLEVWQSVRIGMPPPGFDDPPEIATGWPSPFQDLPRLASSADERAKWLGYVEGQLEYLAAMVLAAYPKGHKDHLRVRWAVIRLRVLFEKLRSALFLPPTRP